MSKGTSVMPVRLTRNRNIFYMGFNNQAYGQFFAQNISELTVNNLPELENLEIEKLVQTFFLITVFQEDHLKEKKSLVFYYLRRIQLIITEYREASNALD